jgi:hypothetical protein
MTTQAGPKSPDSNCFLFVENFGILAESFSENVNTFNVLQVSEFLKFPKNGQVCLTQFYFIFIFFVGGGGSVF